MTTKKNGPERMDLTLAEFCAQMDEYLGRATEVENAIREYRRASDVAASCDSKGEARLAVHAKLDRYTASGQAYWRGHRVVQRRMGGGTKTVLRAASVKDAQPALYEDSRVSQTNLTIKHQGLAAVPRLTLPPMRTAQETWAVMETLRQSATKAKKQAEESRVLMLEVFGGVAEVWSGDARLTSDGWAVGWVDLSRFNAVRCREVAQERDIDLRPLETTETVPPRVQWAVEEVNPEDVDEIDGD